MSLKYLPKIQFLATIGSPFGVGPSQGGGGCKPRYEVSQEVLNGVANLSKQS
jgi:hypothetical protein